ncbi:flippase [Adhaeribacter aquaticus]|uniref:flippase n=1 Tax=Adhaeribacter aquaticus TaxID=299567 RepID=UPI00041A315E|nr:flippase [Adhaeribacter aquaticus]
MLVANVSLKKKLSQIFLSKGVIQNISWLFIDKVFRVGLNFLLTILIARYLGADLFGLWNYVIAFVALFSILSTLGIDSIVTKYLIKEENNTDYILGAAFILKLVGSLFAVILSIISIFLLRSGETLTHQMVLLTSGILVFQSFDVIDYFYQSKLQSKFVVYSRNLAFLLSGLLKIGILVLKGSLILFVWASLLEAILTAIIFVLMYKQNYGSIVKWKINWTFTKRLIKEGYPMALSVMLILVYTRTDQIMLGSLINNNEVGIFSAAVRLSEAWWFVPSIITSSILPVLIKEKEISNEGYLNKLKQSFRIMAYLGVLTAIIVTFFSSFIINLLYGKEFEGAGVILSVHTWTSVFVFLGFASGNWFVVENLQKYVFFRTLAGAIINVTLNLLLIPRYGGLGAAIATLFSQFTASYFFNLFNSKTYPIFIMQTKALLNVITLKDLIHYLSKK